MYLLKIENICFLGYGLSFEVFRNSELCLILIELRMFYAFVMI